MYNCSMVSWQNGEELKRSCWMKFFDMLSDAHDNISFDDINVVGVENPGVDMDKIREKFPAQYGAWLRLRDDASAREPKLEEGTYAQVTKDRGELSARAARLRSFNMRYFSHATHIQNMSVVWMLSMSVLWTSILFGNLLTKRHLRSILSISSTLLIR